VLWYDHFVRTRPLNVLAHELLFATRATARFFETRGVLRATNEVAHAVLATHRRDLLVFPGGDLDVWRPYRERFRVHFAGHLGYARLAVETQTAIVPVAHAGAHETLYVITDGDELARWLGLRKLARAHIWPVHLSLPWGLGFGPLPHIPLPARFRYLFGEPIAPPAAHDERAVRVLAVEVVRRIQAMLDRLRDEG